MDQKQQWVHFNYKQETQASYIIPKGIDSESDSDEKEVALKRQKFDQDYRIC